MTTEQPQSQTRNFPGNGDFRCFPATIISFNSLTFVVVVVIVILVVVLFTVIIVLRLLVSPNLSTTWQPRKERPLVLRLRRKRKWWQLKKVTLVVMVVSVEGVVKGDLFWFCPRCHGCEATLMNYKRELARDRSDLIHFKKG